MKKIKTSILILMTSTFSIFSSSIIHGEDFTGNETYWQNKCANPQTTEEDIQQCELFRDYYIEKRESLDKELSSITSKVDNMDGNISGLTKLLKEIKEKNTLYENSIEVNKSNIQAISTQIEDLNKGIATKNGEINKRLDAIKSRMVDEQAGLGTNMNRELIFGTNDLVDMLRKWIGLQKITESDQIEIAFIQNEKDDLSLRKSEKVRLKKEAELKKSENEKAIKNQEELKLNQEQLLTIYQKQKAQLASKKRSVEVDISSIKNKIISVGNTSDFDFSGNSGLSLPIKDGYLSAGTWSYPGGGAHLGMDIAAPIGTPIYAPADAVVLYADNPVGSNSGFIENWSGYPAGGGNSIEILTQANGVTYAISFFHLAQENFEARAGQTIRAGEVFARVGNSGNSSGPHCHMEVFNLGTMSIEDAVKKFQRTADFAWGNGWGNAAVNNSCEVKGSPCRMRPETVF